MNKANAQKLMNALTPKTCPVTFDYRKTGWLGGPGCVIAVARGVLGANDSAEIEARLGIRSSPEFEYLLGFQRPKVGVGAHFFGMSDKDATGAVGLAEARRRLFVLADKHRVRLTDPTARLVLKRQAKKKPGGTRGLALVNLTFKQAQARVAMFMRGPAVRVSCEPDLDHPGRWLVRAVPR